MSRVNEYCFILQKDVYPYERMDEYAEFKEALFWRKKEFYSNLNMEYITDNYYKQTKKVWKDFEIKNLGKYHNFYVPNDMLLEA